MELVFLLVVAQQVIGDQPQLLLDDFLLLGSHRRSRQTRQRVGAARCGAGRGSV